VKIGYIIGTYPLLTTTFIDRELQGIRERGIETTIISIRRPPPEEGLMPECGAEPQNIVYLLPVNWVRLILAHLYFVVTDLRAYASLLGYLVSRHHPNTGQRLKTVLHFVEGVYAAFLLREQACDHLHAHFADRAATAALCASRLLGKPYSLTVHANDLYAGPVLLLEKIRHARFTVTVSQFNKEFILRNQPNLDAERIVVLHPWVNLNEFQPSTTGPRNRRFSILSVGRLVEKKGHRYLIQACRLLRERGLDVECRIVGGGPLENELRALVFAQQLGECVMLEGPRAKTEVLRRLTEADVFVLASVIAGDGDRDGMPVALAEAMAMQVPVISTNIVGIGELVKPGAGCLVPPQDPVALAHAIHSIYRMDSETRREIGKRGRAIVEADFEVNKGIDCLAGLFRQSSTPATDIHTRRAAGGIRPQAPRPAQLRKDTLGKNTHNGNWDQDDS
jgi:colanic acid/amylovoran biosynthesis glycosyltransferase